MSAGTPIRCVLALDFDGVICDSRREVLQVAVAAYAELAPGSRLADRLAADDDAARELRRRFDELLPLGNRAEDFGVALRSLDEHRSLEDQDAYDRYLASLPAPWLESYHRRFYAHRESLRAADPEAWLALHSPFRRFTDALERRAAGVVLAIATAKDRRSVRLLLRHFGLAGVFADELVLDKETGKDKRSHLEVLSRRLDLPLHTFIFVDDKLNHLERVASLGVRPVLAAWGYNTEREREAARRRGITVAELDGVDRLLAEIAETRGDA